MKISHFYRELILMLLICVSIRTFSKEERKIIAVMDTGITITSVTKPYLCNEGNKDFTGTGLDDTNGHGTNVVGLIAKGIDTRKYCIVMIKFYSGKYTSAKALYDAWDYIVELKPAFANFSYSGSGYYHKEYKTLKNLTENGTIVAVAAGNDGVNLSTNCNFYPACYHIEKNYYVVGATDLVGIGNYSGPVNVYDRGLNQRAWGITESGTSQACANVTNKLVRGLK